MRTVLVLTLLLAASAAGAAEPLAPVRAMRASGPIVVDGVLDEPIWSAAPATTTLVQADPRQGDAATQRSEVRVAYDDDAVYVGARLYDTRPDSIMARLARRDQTNGSDLFAVAFDTFRDRRTGYYFGVSAAGTQFDGTMMNDDWDDDTWDGVWSAKVRRDGQGWTAEMRIPFSQMRCGGGAQRVWGVNFDRYIQRANEDDKLVFTPRGQSGFVSRFPEMLGLDGIRSAHKLEVVPYSTGKAGYLVHPAGDPFHTDAKLEPALGADLRTNVGSKLTLNATANPDFGQVEIDPAVVNLSDVETFFDEKRPFFTEGSSVFRCGNNGASDYWSFNWPEPSFFYSRRIGRAPEGSPPDDARYHDVPVATRIAGALKLTGQPAPGFMVGTLHAVTRKETADYEDTLGTRHTVAVSPVTYFGVARGMRSFHGERQGLGLMALETARSFDGTSLEGLLNRNSIVTAVDGWTFLDAKKTWVVSGYATGSRVDGTAERIASLERDPRHYYQRPGRHDLGVDANATSLTGYGTRLWLNKQSGSWLSNSAIGFLTPGFEVNDLGFGSRSDVINGHVGLGYSWNKPTAWRKYVWMIGALAQSWNFAGQHTMNQVFLKSSLAQMNAWSWTASGGGFGHALNDRRTRGGPAMQDPRSWWSQLHWNSNSKAKLYYTLDVNPNGDEAGSREVYVSPSATWKPAARLSLSAGPNADFNVEDTHFITSAADPLATKTFGGRYVFARLDQTTVGADLRLDYSVTPALSFQVYVQPLVSSGRYTRYRELARAGSYEFLVYGQGGSTVDLVRGVVDPDGAGPAPAIGVGHRDFTLRSLRGNAVLRWEYVPGSSVYLVWTQDRFGEDPEGRFDLSPSLSALSRTPASNIFLVKVSHHFEI
jgi:hypothetical protein